MCLWRPKGTESTLALHVSSPTFERHFSISLAFKSNQSHSIPSSLNDVAILTREHFLLWPCGVLNETHEHQNAQQSESLRKSTTSDKPDDLSSPLVNTWHYCATCEQEPWPSSCVTPRHRWSMWSPWMNALMLHSCCSSTESSRVVMSALSIQNRVTNYCWESH